MMDCIAIRPVGAKPVMAFTLYIYHYFSFLQNWLRHVGYYRVVHYTGYIKIWLSPKPFIKSDT